MSLVLNSDGPGTNVKLLDGQQGLEAAPRGTSALMGQFSSGPVAFAALALTQAQARLISGDPDDDFEASMCLSDLYYEATPPVLIGRVTDGNEIQSQLYIWDRSPDRSYSRTNNGGLFTDREPLATMKAHNGGRWGGAKQILIGELNDITADLTATTIDISTSTTTPSAGSYLVDRYAGATLYIEGDSDGPYTVASQNANGVLTIDGEFSQAVQDADGTGAIDGRFRVVVPHEKELTVVVGQDSVTASRFSLKGERKFKSTAAWETVTSYNDLGLSTNDDKPWTTEIYSGEVEQGRYQLELTTSYSGATVEAKLPANYCESPTAVSGATMTFQWWRWTAGSSNTGNPYLKSIAALNTSSIEPHVYNLTFTAATTFTVSLVWPDGTTQALGTGSTGTLFDPEHPQLTSFTITAGSVAAVANDTLKIRVDPLPHDLYQREAFLYTIAASTDGNSNQRLRIASNTYNSVTVRADLDLEADYGAVAGVAASVDTNDLSAVSITSSQTVILTPDDGVAVTLTSAGSGPGASAIAAELTALDTNDIFVFTPNSDGTMTISVNGSFGSKSKITLGNGTAHSGLGLATSGSVTGTDAIPARIEARMPMWGGYDGYTPDAADYVQALDVGGSIFDRWLTTNLGLVRIGTPSITGSTVKTAGAALAAKHGWKYNAEFSSSFEALSLPGEGALNDMITNESESDYVDHIFPSRAKYPNAEGTKTVLRSVVGQFMGIKARLANTGTDGEKGLHIAAANNNEQGRLSPRCRGLSDDIGRWIPPKKLLNDHGIIMLLWEGPDVYLWGNRMYSVGRTPQGRRYTVTERDVYYHIARDLFVTTRPFIFKSLSLRRLGDVQRSLRDKMKPYHRDGWISDFNGPGFEQSVSVLVPLDLNPPENLQEGLIHCTVGFRPRPSLENLNITITPSALAEE